MAIPSKQIGQPSSTKAALLWEISKQLETLTKVAGNVIITPQITGGWSVVTGGAAGDGTVAQYSPTGFNITGPNDGDNNGWVYIKKYYTQQTELTIDYEWASSDEGISVDWPIYCLDENEPSGIPSDLNNRVNNTPETGTWTISVSANSWFSVGIFTDDSCCGRGFLSINVQEVVIPSWAFVPGEISIFPASSDGYTLYTGTWSSYDDGQTDDTFPLAGDFYGVGISDNTSFLSTNGFMIPPNSGQTINGNRGDLFITPGNSLNDGDTQNFWYQNYVGDSRWRTSILVYCGHCCDPVDQQTPYSYILNIYRDTQHQYIEACAKTNLADSAGPNSNTQPANNISQVWQSDLGGNSWTLLGYGYVQ